MTKLSLHRSKTLKAGKCAPWYVYVLNPSDEIRKTLHEKVGSLDAMVLLPYVQADDKCPKNMFYDEGHRSHFDHLAHPYLTSLRPVNPWPQCTCVSGPGMGWVMPKAGDGILFSRTRGRGACVSWSRPSLWASRTSR